MTTRDKFLWFSVALFWTAVVVGATVWLTERLRPSPEPGQAYVAPQVEAVIDEPKEALPEPIKPKVFKNATKVKKNLKLPDPVIHLDQYQVLDTAFLDGKDDRPKDIASVIDTQTGETKTYIIPKERPWFDVDTRGHAEIAYGVRAGVTTTRLSATQYVFDVKSVRFGVTGYVENMQDRNTETFIGVSASYHW
jgi:hypothetical protein